MASKSQPAGPEAVVWGPVRRSPPVPAGEGPEEGCRTVGLVGSVTGLAVALVSSALQEGLGENLVGHKPVTERPELPGGHVVPLGEPAESSVAGTFRSVVGAPLQVLLVHTAYVLPDLILAQILPHLILGQLVAHGEMRVTSSSGIPEG